jgi:Na+/proline symporter
VPDPIAFLRLTTNEAPPVVGALCLVAIVAASMSTADGAILALGSVMSNNVFRHLDVIYPKFVNEENLLIVARISSLPLTLISTFIAAYYRTGSNENHAAGATGYLLIVAFDIVLATVVVPLFGAFYAKNPSPRAALVSILGGAVTRIALEFVLSKDGSLLLPYHDDIEFLDYGPAASALPPPFVNATEVWDPIEEQCDQRTLEDFTGVDSLAAFLVSLILFISVQFLEHIRKKPLFEFPGGVGYDKSHVKEEDRGEEETDQTWTQSVEVVFAVIVSVERGTGCIIYLHLSAGLK